MVRPRQDAHPWTLAVLDILSDQEWHEYRLTLEKAAELVPPGMAWRKAEYYREYHYKKANKPVAERRHGDRNDTIKTGQRLIVGKTIQDLRRRGRIEVEYDDSNANRKKPKRIRRLV